jgi:mRNA (guanine-N7-)-methyltransferase
MSCGKGGDMPKYMVDHVKFYVGADIAHVSLEAACDRFNYLTRYKRYCQGPDIPPYIAHLISADCHKQRVASVLAPDVMFDFVSCQFSLHYCFENEARARMMLLNCSERLKVGGHFVGTLPDANVLVRKFRESKTNFFGNDHFRITFHRVSR